MPMHTPTPWTFGAPSSTIRAQGLAIADIIYDAGGPFGEGNGKFIARACNSHDELLAALLEARGLLQALNAYGLAAFNREHISDAYWKTHKAILDDEDRAAL